MCIKEAIQEYQCSGCVSGSDLECGMFQQDNTAGECNNHSAAIYATGMGKLLLGMPCGFNRIGVGTGDMVYSEIKIFASFAVFVNLWNGYGKFNIPVWKYLDNHDNTLVRGLMPRVNIPFIHVILGDNIDKIDCLEITNTDIQEMDL